jgi:hypothetical protein
MSRLSFPAPIAEEQVPLTFTAEQKTDIQNTTKKVQQHLAMLPYFMSLEGGESMTREQARLVLAAAESDMAALGRLLGVDTEAAQRIEERHADIRRANLEVRRLEQLLAQQMPTEAIQPALYQLGKQLYRWWQLEGFGHVSDITFGEHSMNAKFSCQFYGSKPSIEGGEGLSRPERRAAWLADLERRGFVLIDDDGKGICDCPASREALRALFAVRLPGAKIAQFVSREGRHGSKLVDVHVYIYKLEQILALPVPAPEADEIDVD